VAKFKPAYGKEKRSKEQKRLKKQEEKRLRRQNKLNGEPQPDPDTENPQPEAQLDGDPAAPLEKETD
jgi:hypothetical protein